MHLSGLFIYPVKSLRGCAVASAAIDTLGLIGDRRCLVVDESGRFLTQRTLPRMAQISTALAAGTLTLSADAHGAISVPPPSAFRAPRPLPVTIWRSENLLADDCGDDVATWLSDFLSTRCRLVRIGEQFHRPVLKSAARPDDVVSFADAVPFLVLSEASLADLNDRLIARGEDALPMNRFRPNLVVAGAPAAFAEDTWPHVRIGDIIFRSAGPSARCAITTTDQLTGERGLEPLRTLATYRRLVRRSLGEGGSPADPTDVIFGHNFIHETKSGTLHLGDPVTPGGTR